MIPPKDRSFWVLVCCLLTLGTAITVTQFRSKSSGGMAPVVPIKGSVSESTRPPKANEVQQDGITVPKALYGRMLAGAVDVLWDAGKGEDVVRLAQPVKAILHLPPAKVEQIERDLTGILAKRRAEEVRSVITYDQEGFGKYVELPPNPERTRKSLDAAIEVIQRSVTADDAAFLVPLLEKSDAFRVWTSPIRVWVTVEGKGRVSHAYQTSEGTVTMGGPWTPFSHLLPDRKTWMGKALASGEHPPASIIH